MGRAWRGVISIKKKRSKGIGGKREKKVGSFKWEEREDGEGGKKKKENEISGLKKMYGSSGGWKGGSRQVPQDDRQAEFGRRSHERAYV